MTPRIAPSVPFDRLLGLCARPASTPGQLAMLAAVAAQYPDWDSLADRAQAHGVAPLVLHHLRASGVPVPDDARRVLGACALRHRKANEIRARCLEEIALAFEERGLTLLVLKGAALARTIYPDPGLRAMSDLDLLVRARDVPSAGEILRELGYGAADEARWAELAEHHHQKGRSKRVHGLVVSVEVHHRLGIASGRARRTVAELEGDSEPLAIGRAHARMLGIEDMLVHVHYHGFKTPLSWPDRLRLVSAADLFGLVERRGHDIDWPLLRRRAPGLMQALGWLDVISPWSDEAKHLLGFRRVACAARVGIDYRGWPRDRIGERAGETLHHVLDTVAPPPWWLGVRHGLPPGRWGYLAGWLRHAWELAR